MYLEKFEEKFLKNLDPLPKNFNTNPQYVLSEKILELDIYSHQIVLSFPKVERHILSRAIPYISSFDGYCSHCNSYISEKNILIDLEAV